MTAVKVVVSAHTHQPYVCTIDDKLVTSAASFGRVVTDIDLELNPAGVITSAKAENVIVKQNVTPDPETERDPRAIRDARPPRSRTASSARSAPTSSLHAARPTVRTPRASSRWAT